MTITISTELLDRGSKTEMARILREQAADHELTAKSLREQAEAIDPLQTGGNGAEKGRRGRKAKPQTTSAKAGHIEPTIGQIAEALKEMKTARVGAIVDAYGYDRAKTLVLLRELATDGKAMLSGKTWIWTGQGPDEDPIVEEPESTGETQ
jgi:hypothetical protein